MKRRQTEVLTQRIEQGAVFVRARRVAADRLTHLARARRGDAAFGGVKMQAAFLERQIAELQQLANLRFRISNHVLVHLHAHLARIQLLPAPADAIEFAPASGQGLGYHSRMVSMATGVPPRLK